MLSGELGQAWTRRTSNLRGNAITPTGTYVRKGILLDTAYYFGSNNVSSTSANSSYNQTSFFDVKLGYINQASFYYGIQYTLRSDATRTTKSNGRGSGFGVGYFWLSGFDVRAYYRFSESFADYTTGTGYQIDFGYSTKLFSHFYIGMLIDYRSITYKYYNLDSSIKNTIMTTFQPSLTLGFLY